LSLLLMVRRCLQRVHARLSTRYGAVSNHEAAIMNYCGLILRDASLCDAPQDEDRHLPLHRHGRA